MKNRIFVGVIAFLSSVAAFGAGDPIREFVGLPSLRTASVGISVLDIDEMKPIAGYDEHRAYIPASIIKLVTSATAIQLLGTDHVMTTRVGYNGNVDSLGVLHGDLIVSGTGDPSLASEFSSRPPTAFVDSVAACIVRAGIRRIEGRIIADGSCFDHRHVSPCWMWEDLSWDYGSGCYGVNYKDNCIRLSVHTDQPGSPARIDKIEPVYPGLSFSNRIQAGEKNTVMAFSAPYSPRYELDGELPANRKAYPLRCSMPDPELLAVYEIAGKLDSLGIGCGQYTTSRLLVDAGESFPLPDVTLLNYPSDTLSNMIRSLNFRSDNLYAEALFRYLSLSDTCRASAKRSAALVDDYWRAEGLDADELFMYDGCGLARNNRISAMLLARILAFAAQQPETGDAFIRSIPLAGEEGTVSRFLRKTRLAGKIRLKSGSMSDVQTFAGYYSTAEKRYAVVVIVNNYIGKRDEIRRAIEELLLGLLPKH